MMDRNELKSKISDIITEELFERFGSPSAAVIGVNLADRIMELVVAAQTTVRTIQCLNH